MKKIFLLILCSTIASTYCMEDSTETVTNDSTMLANLADQTKDAAVKLLSISGRTLQAVPKDYYVKGACGLGAFMGCRFAYHRFQQTTAYSWLTGNRNLSREIDELTKRLNELEEWKRANQSQLDRVEGQQHTTNTHMAEMQQRVGGFTELAEGHRDQIAELYTTTGSLRGRLEQVETQSTENTRRLDEQGAYGQMAKLMQDFGRAAEERGQILGRVGRLETDMRNRNTLFAITMAGTRDGITMPQSRRIAESPTRTGEEVD
jgi:DNA repair exonuclease SbcCD ATPase subunit